MFPCQNQARLGEQPRRLYSFPDSPGLGFIGWRKRLDRTVGQVNPNDKAWLRRFLAGICFHRHSSLFKPFFDTRIKGNSPPPPGTRILGAGLHLDSPSCVWTDWFSSVSRIWIEAGFTGGAS